MKLQLNNIGPFKNTSLKISDVTVIAGANDTGKSYLNKLLFSVMKIVNIDIENTLFDNFLKAIENLFSNLSSRIKNVEQIIDQEVKNQFESLINIKNQDMQNIIESKDIFAIFLDNCLLFLVQIKINSDNFLKKLMKMIDLEKDELKKEVLDFISDSLKEMYKKIVKFESELESIKKVGKDFAYLLLTKNIFNSNFFESIKNKNYLEKKSSLVLFDENNFEFFNFDIDKESLKINKELNNYSDITYISDTFGMSKSILTSMNDSKKKLKFFNYHFNNVSSLFEFKNTNFGFDFDLKIQPKSEVILTEMVLQEKLKSKFKEYFDLPYEVNKTSDGFINKKEAEIKFFNASKGLKIIKSFDKLIYLNIFNKDNILIIDEPEAFIHPEWQYLFINWLLDVTHEIKPFKLVVSTHSPYIIEILESMSTRKFSSEDSKLEFSFNFLSRDENYDATIEQEKYPDKINSKLNFPFNQLEEEEANWDIKNANK